VTPGITKMGVSSSSSPSASPSKLLQRLSTASQNALFSDYPIHIRILSLIGGYFMGRLLFKVGIFVWNHWVPFRRPVDYFEKRYGIGSWVLVKGATGLIGSSFCSFFADRSFNLVLIGQNLEGLEAKSKELRNAHPTVMTKLVVTDLGRAAEDGWIDKIFEQLQGMSVSVLVNAADQSDIIMNATNKDTQVESIRRLLIVNDFPVVLLTTKLLPRLANRYEKLNLRGAIITVSSDAGKRIFPGLTIFGASMALAIYFTVAAGIEYQHAMSTSLLYLTAIPLTDPFDLWKTPEHIR
jgi:NADP-dependent 3-hydroxy acid dehydrogenase YdfG